MAKWFCLFLLVVLQFGFSISSIAQNNDDEVIRVDSSIVVMNAAVTNTNGKGVRGLNPKLFHVFEDGQEQEIKSFDAEETSFAAVILLDTSGSMEERVTLARAAAIQFLDGMRGEDFTAIYKFDSKIEELQGFSNSRDITDHIFEIKAYGMTLLNDAVVKASELLAKRPEKRRAIIVLSDGADTMSKASADKALRAALAANANIYTVDMSAPDADGKEHMQTQGVLKNFAEKTGGRFVATSGGPAMRDAFKRIVEELGLQYTIAYQPSNSKKDGKWRAIELRVSRPNLTIRTRKGYNAPKAK